MSLRQAYAGDHYREGITEKQYKALPQQEITWNWTVIPADELETHCHVIAHLDAKAFRYYIPAFMVSCLNEPSPVRDTVLYYLCPDEEPQKSDLQRYALLDNQQRSAIAHFLFWYPDLVAMSGADKRMCMKALETYWHEYL